MLRIVAAAQKHGVSRAVVLSSVGAQSEAVGPVSAVAKVEAAFEARLANVTSLRAGLFMENYLRDVGTIAALGKIFSPADGDRPLPVVATVDIAGRAAELLRDRGASGHRKVGVHGPRDLTMREAAGVLSEALGQPVEYVQVSFEQARAAASTRSA